MNRGERTTGADLLAVDSRVQIFNSYADKNLYRLGRVVGHGIIMNNTPQARSVYLVELDEGFYSPEQDLFIKTISCDPHVVSPIKV